MQYKGFFCWFKEQDESVERFVAAFNALLENTVISQVVLIRKWLVC